MGLTFYNSFWDYEIPFDVSFYPQPNSKGYTAQAYYSNSISAMPTELKDFNALLAVVLQEIFHLLYDSQVLSFKNEIDSCFKANKSDVSVYVYLLMNEVLATALGNGYVYEKLNGDVYAGWGWPEQMAEGL